MARTRQFRGTGLTRGHLRIVPVMLRHLRQETVLVAALFVVVLVTGFMFAGIPRWFNQVSDDGIRHAVREANVISRNLNFSVGDTIPPSSDQDNVFAGIEARGDEIQSELPESVQSIIGEQRYLVDSMNFSISEPPGQPAAPFQRFLNFRYQEDIDEHIELVDGEMPEPRDPVSYTFDQDAGEQEIPLYEVAISQEAADLISAQLGDRIILRPDRESQLTRDVPGSALDYRLAVEISGIIEPDDPDLEYWMSDLRLHRPDIQETPDVTIIFAAGLMAPADYPRLDEDTGQALFDYQWRYFVDPDRLDAGMTDELIGNVRNLEVTYGSAILNPVTELSVQTGLARILTDFSRQRQFTISVLALAAIGIFAVSLAVVSLLAMLISERRREETLLIRSRGGSSGQLLVSRLAEGLVITLPAALLGYLVAVTLIESRASLWSIIALFGIPVVAAVLLTVSALRLIRRDLGRLYREQEVPHGTSPKRLVLEAGIVAVAIAGIVLLQRRGLTAGGNEFDPFLAAVPVLLGLAVGVVTLRLFPYPVRLLGWLASLRRDLVLFVGFRRIAQQTAAARLPILIILLAVGIAVFASIIQYSIDEGQQESVWQEVGADYSVQSTMADAPLSRRVDISGVDGIESMAMGHINDSVRVSQEAFTFVNTTLFALDTPAYAEVTGGTRAEPDFPSVLLSEQITQGIGTASNPIPAIISNQIAAELTLDTSDDLVLSFGPNQETYFIVRGIRDRFPGFQAGGSFIIAPLESVRAANRDEEFRPTDIFIRGDRAVGQELRETVRGQSLGARTISRYQIYDDIHEAPLVAGVVTGFRGTLVLAAIFAALAGVTALALTARARARDLGYLRTLGLSSPQSIGVTVVEQLPQVIVAGAAGTALGVAVARLVQPGVDLAAFVGTALPVSLRFDWSAIALLSGGLILIVGAAIIIFSAVTRKQSLGDVLRLGDNE